MKIFALMTVQHTGTRSLYTLFEANGYKRIKFGNPHEQWDGKKKGILFYGHPLLGMIEPYEEMRDEVTCVALERPYKEIRESWEERYGTANGPKIKSWPIPNHFDVWLDEQYEYWLREVKPYSVVVDLHNPEPMLKKLGLTKGKLDHLGKRAKDMEPMVATVEVQ